MQLLLLLLQKNYKIIEISLVKLLGLMEDVLNLSTKSLNKIKK